MQANKRWARFTAACALLLASAAAAQEPAREAATDFATVEIDGKALFGVRGIQARPAAQRAGEIAANITALASDTSFDPATLRSEERDGISYIMGGSRIVMGLDDAEASIQGVERRLLVPTYVERIRRAIIDYREARSPAALTADAARSAAALLLAAAVVALMLWLLRRGEAALQRAVDRGTAALAAEAPRLERLRTALRGAIGVVRVLVVLIMVALVLEYVLTQFPWTRSTELRLFGHVAAPLATVGKDFVAAIPNVLFLLILFLIAHYALLFARLYFGAIQRGKVKLVNFEPEWAPPTYNVVRIAVIATALVSPIPISLARSPMRSGVSRSWPAYCCRSARARRWRTSLQATC